MRPAGFDAARRSTLLVLALGLAATLALAWPGQLSWDSLEQLLDGRTGRLRTWHPPVMAWLLGVADRVHRGAGAYVAAQATLLFGALMLVVWRAPRVRAIAPLAALAAVALPHLVLWQGLVWKDVLFADLVVAGFVALGASAGRGPGVVAAGVCLALAALARQNGAVAVLAGAATLAAIRRGAGVELRPALSRGVAFLAACLLGAGVAGFALEHASADHGEGGRQQMRALQLYDLDGVLHRQPTLPLDRLTPAAAEGLRGEAARRYTPERLDPLLEAPAFAALMRSGQGVAAQWRATVAREPLAWARHRATVFWTLFATPDLAACRPDFVGVDGAPATLKALGLRPAWRPQDLALSRYVARFHGTPVCSHLAWAALAFTLALWPGRATPMRLAMRGLCAGALAFAASFALIGVACDYRYLYALDLAALVAGFAVAVEAPLARGEGDPTSGASPEEPPCSARSPPPPAFP